MRSEWRETRSDGEARGASDNEEPLCPPGPHLGDMAFSRDRLPLPTCRTTGGSQGINTWSFFYSFLVAISASASHLPNIIWSQKARRMLSLQISFPGWRRVCQGQRCFCVRNSLEESWWPYCQLLLFIKFPFASWRRRKVWQNQTTDPLWKRKEPEECFQSGDLYPLFFSKLDNISIIKPHNNAIDTQYIHHQI